MNPLKLLTKSHTFEDAKDRRGTYKFAEHGLPKFANVKGPAFAPEQTAEPLQTALFEQPQRSPAVKAAVPPQRDSAPPPAPKSSPNPFKEKSAPESVWRRAARWGAKLFTWRPLPANPAAIVQTELALEKVTVIRNDLNEDDLVVVTVDKKHRSAHETVERQGKTPKP